MTTFPKVSIIIPVYNTEKYIRQCLESVINQTYKNIEIICINDCSTDKSFEIVKEYAKNDNRFIITEQEQNQGAGSARNRAINITTGKYVVFIDSDDYIDKNLITKCYEYMNKFNYDFIEFNAAYTDENGKILSTVKNSLGNKKFKEKNYVNNPEYIFLSHNYIWNKFYDLDFIKKNNILNSSYRIWDNVSFSIKTKILSQKHIIINDILYFYRQKNNDEKTKKSPLAFNIFKAISDLNIFLYSLPQYKKYKKYYTQFICNELLDIWHCIPVNRRCLFRETINTFLPAEVYSLIKEKNYKKLSFIKKIFSVKDSLDNKHIYITLLGIQFKIRKKQGNYIYVIKNGNKKEVKRVKGVKFHFLGEGAVVELYAEPQIKFKNTEIYLGNESFISIQSSKHHIHDCHIDMRADSSKLFIDKDFSCESLSIYNVNESNMPIKIGKDCMFSYNITIRVTDGHAIYDINTNTILNKPNINGVSIGNHVWICGNVSILKNSQIPSDSIVAANAVVNKQFNEENSIIAGIPAKIIKNKINWDRNNVEVFDFTKNLRGLNNE